MLSTTSSHLSSLCKITITLYIERKSEKYSRRWRSVCLCTSFTILTSPFVAFRCWFNPMVPTCPWPCYAPAHRENHAWADRLVRTGVLHPTRLLVHKSNPQGHLWIHRSRDRGNLGEVISIRNISCVSTCNWPVSLEWRKSQRSEVSAWPKSALPGSCLKMVMSTTSDMLHLLTLMMFRCHCSHCRYHESEKPGRYYRCALSLYCGMPAMYNWTTF